MSLIARSPSHVSSSTSVSPVKRCYGNQDPWSSIAKKEERWERPDIVKDRLKVSASLQQASQSGMTTALGVLKSGKTDIETYDRSGRLDETSWRTTREVRLGFSHEETLHDGTAQSVMNEETPRDTSGWLENDSPEVTWPQHFVIGNDEAETGIVSRSRSFVNRVMMRCEKDWKEISIDTENGEKHSAIWECLWL